MCDLAFSILSRKLFPNRSNFLQECFDFLFKEVKKDDLKYLLLDSNPLSEMPHTFKVRSFIFPNSQGKIQPVLFFPEQRKSF
jgi:hypothetical protein